MQKRWFVSGLAVVLVLGACAEEKKVELPGSPLVTIADGLTFTFGTTRLCYAASVPVDERVDCQDIKAGMIDWKVYPTVEVELAPFAIEATEVTNAQYQACVEDGACTPPASREVARWSNYYQDPTLAAYPVVNVSWQQASAYCAWLGRRLPTEFEWERVAGGVVGADVDRGARNAIAGAEDDVSACQGLDVVTNYCAGATEPKAVGTAADDVITEAGGTIRDLAGNVAEWTATRWSPSVTCEETFDECTDCFTCVPTDTVCERTCNVCPACEEAEDDCYVQCPKNGPLGRGFPICKMYRAVLANPTGPTEGDSRAIRGAHFGTDATRTCQLRVSDRTQEIRGASLQPYDEHVGFRCAAPPPPPVDEE